MILINDKGENLGIYIDTIPKINSEEYLVDLDGYYEVLNEQRYNKAIYDFNLKKWVGVGEQRPIEIQSIPETQKLWDMIDYLINSSYTV